MDPNAWQAYQAYTNRFNAGGGREEANPYPSNTASLFLAHQQLREAASQHYQNQIFPPSLMHAAAANNKTHLHQQALANLNMSSASILSPSVTPWKATTSHQDNILVTTSSANRLLVSDQEQPSISIHQQQLQQQQHQLHHQQPQPQAQPQQPQQQRRTVIETKSSQPAFPGQPPPLQETTIRLTSSLRADPQQQAQQQQQQQQTAFHGQQPPPRQSSQPRSSAVVHSQPAFPGIAPPHSPGHYANSFSPQAPSPQNYHCNSPQDLLQREREKEQERRRLREEEEQKRREQAELIRREQERIRLEQAELKRREQERIRMEQERMRQEQERIRKEQEEQQRRKEYERRKREEQERRKREEMERQRKEQERLRILEQERLQREQERARLEQQERIRKEQERIKQEQEQIEQLKLEEQQRDLGLARLGALGALHDLGEAHDMINYEQMDPQQQQNFQHLQNFHELGMLNSNHHRQVIKEEKPPVTSHYSSWINRANELLDLSSNDSRENNASTGSANIGNNVNNSAQPQDDQEGGAGFIPQILMNPWDPQQPPVMTLAPIANAMQQYQQQWLTQYQQASITATEETPATVEVKQEEETNKSRVICPPPDDEMGFLISLPAPCNLLYQPPTEGVMRGRVDSPFYITFQKFLKDSENFKREELSEAPDKPPEPLPNQYNPTPRPASPELAQPVKKLYIPPYTPRAVKKEGDPDNVRVSASGYSKSLVEPVRRPPPTPSRVGISPRPSQSRENNGTISFNRSNKHVVQKKSRSRVDEDEEEYVREPEPIQRRESSRRKAKEQSKAKREAQDSLLMDDEDPTLNNPALDLDDSDVDDEWTPSKEKDNMPGRRKQRDSSDDEDYEIYDEDYNKKHVKKRSYPEPDKFVNKRSVPEQHNTIVTSIVPDTDDFKIGDFLVLKSEASHPCAPMWRVDGKTLIQKYECQDKIGVQYKNVNTYSGWTPSTRHKYDPVPVKILRSTGKEVVVERLKDAAVKSAKPNNAVADNSNKEAESPSHKSTVSIDEMASASRQETAQFQENFEVYMQTLISQCLDPNFLNEIFSEQDEYFVSNIEKVDSVTLLRKDKVLNGVSWTIRFKHAIGVWPIMKDLGSGACTSTVCGACEKNKANTMLQMLGQPYHPNTLSTLSPDKEAMMNRNFSVCDDCSRLCKLYHKLHHQKHQLFVICSDIVEKRKNQSPGIDTTQILNQLLADDAWLEQQFKVMQDLWANADTFQK